MKPEHMLVDLTVKTTMTRNEGMYIETYVKELKFQSKSLKDLFKFYSFTDEIEIRVKIKSSQVLDFKSKWNANDELSKDESIIREKKKFMCLQD